MRYKLPHSEKELELLWHNQDQALPTLIFLHDSLGCIELWRDFPKKLAELCNCNYLIYDRLGYGKSDRNQELAQRGDNYLEEEADILIQLVKDLQISEPILFGHSDGGSISLIAGGKEADLFKAIITEGAHVFVEEITLAGIRAILPSFPVPLKSRLLKYHGEKVDDVFNAWQECWLRDSYKSWNIESFLSAISCPLFIIQGREDEFGTLKQVASIEKRVSSLVQTWIPKGVGHNPHKELEEECLEKSQKFILDIINTD